ncbi:helix-turn-helix domain-containing protein [Streptomyces sp. NPDC094447]|uniref:helix-turn-helix domain-containing protein n=1 Tax=Streptomyces sp. NPDC094447 TaxID=3366062 RepID=UPI0037F5E01E
MTLRAQGAPELVATTENLIVAGRLHAQPGYRTRSAAGTDDWLLLLTCQGRGVLRSEGGVDVHAARDSFLAIAPGTPHDYGIDTRAREWHLLWAHVRPRPEWLALLHWPSVAPGVERVLLLASVADRVRAALTRTVSLSGRDMPHSALFGINAVEEALLWCGTQKPGGERLDPRLIAVLEHLSLNLAQPHTVHSLARLAGLSESRLSRLFTAQFGTSVMAHVEARWMDVTCRLLRLSSLTVREVALHVGYEDPLYFLTGFRHAMGCSPSAYRDAGG